MPSFLILWIEYIPLLNKINFLNLVIMKKLFLVAFILVSTVVVACSGNNEAKDGEGNGAVQAEAVASDLAQFDAAEFSFSYPKAMKSKFTSSRVINLITDDKKASFDMTYMKMGPAVEELEYYAGVNEDKMKNNGEEVEKPVIEGNVLKIRSVKDGQIKQFFVIAHDGKKSITGELKYDQSLAGEYDAYVDAIIKSYKFK